MLGNDSGEAFRELVDRWKLTYWGHFQEAQAPRNTRVGGRLVNYALTVVVWLVLGTSAPAAWAQDTKQQQPSATDLVEMALRQNREYLAVREKVSETQALLRQAGIRPTPTLEVEFSTGSPLKSAGENEYSTGLFQPVETAGKRDKRIQVAQKAVELAQVDLDERRRQLRFEVQSQYIQALSATNKLAAIHNLISVSRNNYDLIHARVREGDAAPLDEKLLLVDSSRLDAQAASLLGQANSSLLELKRFVGLSGSDSLALPAVSDPSMTNSPPTVGPIPSLAELQRIAMQNRPDLQILRLLEDQGGAEARLAQAEGRPDITASVRYIHRESQFPQLGLNSSGATVPLVDKDNILAFGLSVPIFTGNRTQGDVAAARSRQAEARLRREFLESSIPLEVESAYRHWEAASQAATLFASGVIAQGEDNLAVIRESYRLGQLPIVDILSEQRRFIDTQVAYIDAQADVEQAVAELERAVGGAIR
jgi:cobalt-zinc-cadmium efflux system outer membrane protein